MKILNIKSREIFDSRGNPTVETEMIVDGHQDPFYGLVPSGASTGKFEALELRDNDKSRMSGKGVLKAVSNVNKILKPELINTSFKDFREFDSFLINFDGTSNKSKYGANSILSLSLAFYKAWSYINFNKIFLSQGKDNLSIPVPMLNIINGGQHADNDVDFQEFMILPINFSNLKEALSATHDVITNIKKNLKSKSHNTNVGDEGGFAPNLKSHIEVLDIICNSIEKSGYQINTHFKISLDSASSEFYESGFYNFEGKKLNTDQMIKVYENICNNFPIFSIEDALDEEDYEGWTNITSSLGEKIKLVGDDLFVTNIEKLQTGIIKKQANSILIKLNQIGSVSETLDSIKLANDNNFVSIMSHRSGETEDSFISDLAVASKCPLIKTGSLARSDRVSKYNQLLRIEESEFISSYAGNDNSVFKI
ncbi:MAG: phosphopyruvate hydratase [Pelagibacteraceae bacterium]|nr:phosphopyruvate hydratase [Pelagibacteraceae bacterium]